MLLTKIDKASEKSMVYKKKVLERELLIECPNCGYSVKSSWDKCPQCATPIKKNK